MDPSYEPTATETRTLYGLQLEQKRNDALINAAMFSNVVSKNQEVLINIYFSIENENYVFLKKCLFSLQVIHFFTAQMRLNSKNSHRQSLNYAN